MVRCEWGWWMKSNVWCGGEIWLQLPNIFLSFPLIYSRNQHRFGFSVAWRHEILIDASLARDRRNVRRVIFSFPMISFTKLRRHKSKVPAGKRYARAENKIRECCEIEGSILTNRISVHHVLNPHFVPQNSRKWKMYRKNIDISLKSTRRRTI